jgi:hypothetical protein
MACCVVLALSSPYPPPQADGWSLASLRKPTIVARKIPDPAERARAYLVATASAGGTMAMLGKVKSLACFHRNFAINLAAAIRDARDHGMADVGVLSGCRPPALGIGGFRDKFNSMHAYGLAADMSGIGTPGSKQAKRWHAIAARHGVACVYGPSNRAEWNHCQGTLLKVAPARLRKTTTAKGPKDLDAMWQAAASIVLAVDRPIATRLPSAQVPRTKAKRHKARRVRTAHRHKARHARAARHARHYRAVQRRPSARRRFSFGNGV